MNVMTFHSVWNFIIPTDELHEGVGIPPTGSDFQILKKKNLYQETSRREGQKSRNHREQPPARVVNCDMENWRHIREMGN